MQSPCHNLKLLPGLMLNVTIELIYKNKIILYSYIFEWKKNNKKGKIKSENLSIKDINNNKFTQFILRNHNEAKYKPSEKSRCSKKITISSDNLVINKLSSNDDLFFIEIINKILNLSYFQFSVFGTARNYYPSPIEYNCHQLDIEHQNIPKLVYFLKDEHPNQFELLINSFTNLFSFIESIIPIQINVKKQIKSNNLFEDDSAPFSINNNIYKLLVKEEYNNQPTEFTYLSEGTRRIFILLLVAIMSNIHGITLIAIEELENNIHPKLFRDLLITLDNLADDFSILITSHSPYLLQFLDLNNVYVGLTRQNNIAEFKKLKVTAQKKILKQAYEEHISTGDVIFNMLIDNDIDYNFFKVG
jgi:predicted ATP-dependent endonuclease of OLD family